MCWRLHWKRVAALRWPSVAIGSERLAGAVVAVVAGRVAVAAAVVGPLAVAVGQFVAVAGPLAELAAPAGLAGPAVAPVGLAEPAGLAVGPVGLAVPVVRVAHAEPESVVAVVAVAADVVPAPFQRPYAPF